MAPAIPCSASTVALSPGTTSRSRKIYNLTRYDFLVTSKLQPLLERRFFLPVSISLRSSPKYGCAAQHGFGVHIVAAAGNDIAEEGPDSAIAGEDDEILEIPINAVETGKAPSLIADANTTHAKSKRQRPVRKSETPTVKNEELVPGATFTGKVISIQPFGAFVDIGAFTDGLVHVSQLGNNYVEDVGKVVFIGQEVKVRIVEANIKTGRIALTMRKVDDNDITKLQEQGDAPSASSDKLRPGRGSTSSPGQERDVVEKSSKFVKGQILQATIKNLTRVGAFVSLPESEEGFLPTAEESDEAFASMMGGSALKVGQEVSVRVLRISKGGQVTLTMKKDEAEGLNSKLVQGVVHPATNPFAMAFRKNKDVVTFWDETRKVQKPAGTSEKQKSSQEMERSQKPN